jgi:pimeloyl-ACP methyl ester carboxylesterase
MISMMRQHHIIYVPGILDDIYHAQSLAAATWRIYGVHGHCHPIPWAGQEIWEVKFKRLLDEIDRYKAEGHEVSLIGASAGASAILNAYVERAESIKGLIYICAKINAPETVSKKTYAENPAFKTSLELLQRNLKKLTPKDKARMLSLYSPSDNTVPYPATVIEGVEERRLPALRHGRAIMFALTLGVKGMTDFLKKV